MSPRYLALSLLSLAAFGCKSSTEPDDNGKLGYAHFSGVVRTISGGGIPDAQVSIVCGVNILVEWFSAQQVSGPTGAFATDLDVPGTLSNPSPSRTYDCRIEAIVTGSPLFFACNMVTVTFGASPEKRKQVTVVPTEGHSCL